MSANVKLMWTLLLTVIPTTNTLPCLNTMQLPCTLHNLTYNKLDNIMFTRDSHIYTVICQEDNQTYVIKFTQNEFADNDRILDEATITDVMHKKTINGSSSLSIKLYHYDRQTTPLNHKLYQLNTVLVMEYAPLGNVRDVTYVPQHKYQLTGHRDEFVLKFLSDQATVLSIMWHNQLIDRDFKLRNVLVMGNLSDPLTTRFVKIDYGRTIKIADAEKQLLSVSGRFAFCQRGTNASPLDIAIMYGKTRYNESMTSRQKLLKQQQQIRGAIALLDNLESNDIIDLVQAATTFYDLITINEKERIGVGSEAWDHSQKSRRDAVTQTISVLNEHYNNCDLKNPDILPKTVKELLIKYQWLSIQQDYQNNKPKMYFNWNTMHNWINSVAWHQQHLQYGGVNGLIYTDSDSEEEMEV